MADVPGLEKLQDIHLPAPVSWWPLAPGWYALAALILLVLTLLAAWTYRRHRKERFKREALCLLSEYETHYQQTGEAALASAQVSELLRRVALLYYPREDVASLRDRAWLEFLDNSSARLDFKALSRQLLELPYQASNGDEELAALFTTARAWIKQRGTSCLN